METTQNNDYGYDIQKVYLEMLMTDAESFVRCQGKMRALKAFLMHPHIAHIQGQIVTGRPCTDHHHTAFFAHEG